MHGLKILYEISKVPFEISHILNPYIGRYAFTMCNFFFDNLRYLRVMTS